MSLIPFPDVPVCIQCEHHKPGHICGAIYDVVTGELLDMSCADARADQLLCGRKGELFSLAE